MANTSRINGLKPVMTLNGSPYNGQGILCYKAAGTTVTNDIGVGDPVCFSGSGDTKGVPGISKVTMGDTYALCGFIQGVKFDPDHPDRDTWIDGADAGYVYVCMDPNVVFEGQADAALTYTDINYNAPLVQTSALDRTAGTSGVSVDATIGTSATDQVKLIGFPQREDNEINATYNKVLVVINNHQLKGGTGTVGT